MWIDDQMLERCEEQVAVASWVPARPMVVLGSSNRSHQEVHEAHCAADGVAILKRYGGGGTVVLHPGCAVVSVGCWVAQTFQNGLYFDRLNRATIGALAERWPQLADLSQNGLSDLSFGDRKVAGTSLFRSRNYLLYQASILVDARIALIERYLQHPSKEPEYRAGRSHRHFLIGLNELVADIAATACVRQLEQRLATAVALALGDQLVQPVAAQWPNLYSRARQH